ncbi:MAG: penicillin-binding protein [Lachnospiraceae bacterium]|nr:penicillin-binding protein [Lachnospiraceae bacterium]
MLKELLEYLGYKLKQMVTSRLFPLMIVFGVLFGALLVRMYKLQIVLGAEAEKNVQDTVTRVVSISPTRGNIYDRNGKLLAYNELVQTVTVTDNGDYSNGYERNKMLIRLIGILDRYGEEVVRTFDVYYDENGELQESFASDAARLRFLRDMYGLTNVSLLTDEQKDTTSQQIVDYYIDRFGIGKNSDKTTYEIDPQTALKVAYIRFSMYANYYVRYNASVVARGVREETVAAIREHAAELKGVDIAQDYVRRYNNAEYFCHILGYTGSASTDEIETLNAAGGDYVAGDIIGKAGIENSMELYLHGTRGSMSLYVNNFGQIQQVADVIDAKAGDDIYLTIDADLQMATYHLLEQKLAGILMAHMKNEDVNPDDPEHFIPLKQAYYQMIGNNVLDIRRFASEEAGEAEKRLQAVFEEAQAAVLKEVSDELLSLEPKAYKDMSEDMQDYFSVLYDILLDRGLLIKDSIDTASDLYAAYRTNGEFSLQEYLREALKVGWVDVTRLKLEDKYTSSEEVYRALIRYIMTILEDSTNFSKAIYEKMIYAGTVSLCDIGLALFDQGAIKEDPEYRERLSVQTDEAAFTFMLAKINSIEITPAQLALDPYSASATVVDVTSGKILALVSYPGYDNNRISDSAYYSALLQDQSTPLFNAATQARTAPGSIFKLVTASASLETGLIGPDTYFTTHGLFSAAGMDVRCWIYPGSHGDINVWQALMYSCNDFFCQMGYRMSLVDGVYTDSVGVSILQEYATKLGLGSKSGIEIAEYSPVISDTSAITTAIGQGTNLFANVHLARYVTTVASRGNVYDLTLLDRRTDADGQIMQLYTGNLISKTEFDDTTWDTIWRGMRRAIESGSSASVFSGNVILAGKTGTAKENDKRPNHATFVSFAPYNSDPEISVTVTIPNGYTSGNTAELGGYIYDYYYGYLTYDEIMGGNAKDNGGNNVVAD